MYNTRNHRSYEFLLEDCVREACAELSDLDKLYRVPCETWMADFGFKAFAAEVESRGLGCVHEESDRVYLPPFLSLQQDRLRGQGKIGSTDVLRNFLSLTVYMGGRGWEGEWHKQAEYPSSFVGFMPQERLKAFLLRILCCPCARLRYFAHCARASHRRKPSVNRAFSSRRALTFS